MQQFDLRKKSDIDMMVDKLNISMKEASGNLPKIHYRPQVKPLWSKELNQLKELLRIAWIQ